MTTHTEIWENRQKEILTRLTQKPSYISRVCKGIVDNSYGYKLLRDLEIKQYVKSYNDKYNKRIIRITKKGFEYLGFKKIKVTGKVNNQKFEHDEPNRLDDYIRGTDA